MLSSTFNDLKEHRAEVIKIIEKLEFKPEVMEFSGANAERDVIQTSMKMVEDAAAYIGVISHRYGQTPVDPVKNKDNLSISELEFERAKELDRPILLFVMSDEHPVTKADVETDSEKIEKLANFRKKAKKMNTDGDIERIFEVFENKDDLAVRAATAIAKLVKFLQADDNDSRHEDNAKVENVTRKSFEAIPSYLASHDFIGRKSELSTLNDWCTDSDTHPILLFEAIGGQGKSILTWEWITKYSQMERTDWEGRFWYSFYERGAVMSSFCQHALSYMTGKPLSVFSRMRMPELSARLMGELQAKPWLLVLDGLERVLVAYHRSDAAILRDEDVDTATDQIAHRNPRDAISPEDDDLLRFLATATPSKILISTRLTPRALLNNSGMPRPGVRREYLGGLRPPDAEALLRSCGIEGDSDAIRRFLKSNCDCHPLVTGTLAGLVNNFLPDRGNFDSWVADPSGGKSLNLAELDLVQRKNNIVTAAVDALASESLQLLQTLSIMQSGADYETLLDLNPHLPPAPAKHSDATPLPGQTESVNENRTAWDAWQEKRKTEHYVSLLAATISDLENRGLLQYDRNDRRYDLHPVVRGVTSGRIGGDQKSSLGERVVDHMTSRDRGPIGTAQSLEDLSFELQTIRTLLNLENYDKAWDIANNVLEVVYANFNAVHVIQEITYQFFTDGWESQCLIAKDDEAMILRVVAALSLWPIEPQVALGLSNRNIANVIDNDVDDEGVFVLVGFLLLAMLMHTNDVALCSRLSAFVSDHNFKEIYDNSNDNSSEIIVGIQKAQMGDTSISFDVEKVKSEELGALLFLCIYLIEFLNFQSDQTINLKAVESWPEDQMKWRPYETQLFSLRGLQLLDRSDPESAARDFETAVRMNREVGLADATNEAYLCLAQHRAGASVDAFDVAERLSNCNNSAALAVAELWHELGDDRRATSLALRAHNWAVADGEPYVLRWQLDRTRRLLAELGERLPTVPEHDPASVVAFPWEKNLERWLRRKSEESDKRLRNELASPNS